MIKPPKFWWGSLPFYWKPFRFLSWIYRVVSRVHRFFITSERLSVPIICVGNLTVGGTGKTPVALSLGNYFLDYKKKVGFLTRGYGGKLRGPVRVMPHHTASEVGDEPLLLCRSAPTWVSRDRVKGAHAMVQAGIDVIIMDDGHQNTSLYKDLSLIVVDGIQGFGNKEIFPFGPLRESLKHGFRRADGVVVVRNSSCALKKDLSSYEGPIFHATMTLNTTDRQFQKVVAFCGIGNPEKFFNSLENIGIEIIEKRSFPDHYTYKLSDLVTLKKIALEYRVPLVTTEKDWVRLSQKDQKDIFSVPVSLEWKDWDHMKEFLEKKIPK